MGERTPHKYHGWDLGLNHAGFVELNEDGSMAWWYYVAEKAKLVTPGVSDLFRPSKADRDTKNVWRLRWWKAKYRWILAERQPTHVAVEDYAIASHSNSAYQIGEMGGQARLAVIEAKAALRLHDPLSVKMWGADNGNATPDELGDMVRLAWPETQVWDSLPPDPQYSPRLDLCAAYVLAVMVHAEVLIREGKMRLEDLAAPKQIQVFNRVTKANPVNLLGRELITW